MCRKLECKQDDMKSFCKIWSDRHMYWIIVINMNFQNTEVSSQSGTLQAVPPPTHLWDQKEQGKGGSRGREETQPFWELGIAGIVSKLLTSDDEAWITEQMCNREKPQNKPRDRMLIVRQIRGRQVFEYSWASNQELWMKTEMVPLVITCSTGRRILPEEMQRSVDQTCPTTQNSQDVHRDLHNLVLPTVFFLHSSLTLHWIWSFLAIEGFQF